MAFSWTEDIAVDAQIKYDALAEIRTNVDYVKDNEVANVSYCGSDDASQNSSVDNNEHSGYDSSLNSTVDNNQHSGYDGGVYSGDHGNYDTYVLSGHFHLAKQQWDTGVHNQGQP